RRRIRPRYRSSGLCDNPARTMVCCCGVAPTLGLNEMVSPARFLNRASNRVRVINGNSVQFRARRNASLQWCCLLSQSNRIAVETLGDDMAKRTTRVIKGWHFEEGDFHYPRDGAPHT